MRRLRWWLEVPFVAIGQYRSWRRYRFSRWDDWCGAWRVAQGKDPFPIEGSSYTYRVTEVDGLPVIGEEATIEFDDR